MARQLQTQYTGAKGPLSFYTMYDTFYVRTKSPGGKQTQRTKARQQDFAIAASLSKYIRLTLQAAIPNPKQKAMQNRLTAALLQWQLSRSAVPVNTSVIEQLQHFQFTEIALSNIFQVPLSIQASAGNGLEVIIPAFIPKQAIQAPAHTKQIHIIIAAGRCSIASAQPAQSLHTSIIIPCNNKLMPQQAIPLPLKALQPSVTVVAIALRYWVKQQNFSQLLQVKQKAWSPAAIVYATAG